MMKKLETQIANKEGNIEIHYGVSYDRCSHLKKSCKVIFNLIQKCLWQSKYG